MTTNPSLCFLYFNSFLFHSAFKPSDKHVTDCLLCFHDLQYGMGSGGGSKASFTPFVDPRVYGTSPTDDDDNISASGTFGLWHDSAGISSEKLCVMLCCCVCVVP